MTTNISSQASAQQQVSAQPKISLVVQNIAAVVFGAIVLFAVGFLPMEAAHTRRTIPVTL